jgi:hypothetical protein
VHNILFLSGLANGHLPLLYYHASQVMSANDKGDNELNSGATEDLLSFTLRLGKNLRKPQLGDHLVKPQMGSFTSKLRRQGRKEKEKTR